MGRPRKPNPRSLGRAAPSQLPSYILKIGSYFGIESDKRDRVMTDDDPRRSHLNTIKLGRSPQRSLARELSIQDARGEVRAGGRRVGSVGVEEDNVRAL